MEAQRINGVARFALQHKDYDALLACDLLLSEHRIYVQLINYPTVPRRLERIRITPSPYHDDELMDDLAGALGEVWDKLNLLRYDALLRWDKTDRSPDQNFQYGSHGY